MTSTNNEDAWISLADVCNMKQKKSTWLFSTTWWDGSNIQAYGV